LIYNEARQPFVFSHSPVPIGYQINDGHETVDGNIAKQQAGYAGLSPYGPWHIKVDLASIPRGFLHWANPISRVSLVFDGLGRGIAAPN
jgi:hypothetical protein